MNVATTTEPPRAGARPPTDTPLPVHTSATYSRDARGRPQTDVHRLWSEDDRAACRLCEVCTAIRGPRGLDREGRRCRLWVCVFKVRGTIRPKLARLFAPGRPLRWWRTGD